MHEISPSWRSAEGWHYQVWRVSLQDVPVVPIAGLSGENLVSKSAEMPWYAGPTAIESLDALGDMNRPAEPRKQATAVVHNPK